MNENVTLAEFFEQYYLDQCAELDDKTIHSRTRLMQKYVFPLFGHEKVRDMDADFINRLRESLSRTQLSDSGIYQIFTVIRGVLKLAVSMGLISQFQYPLYTKRFPNSPDHVRGPSRSSTPHCFTWDEMARIEMAFGNTSLDWMHRLALLAGLKRDELFGLKASDYDHEKKCLSIRTVMKIHEKGRTPIEFIALPSENPRNRTIPLGPKAQQAVEAAIEEALNREPEECDPYLFRRENGGCYLGPYLREYSYDIRRKSGVNEFSLRNLRETFMVFCFLEGWSTAEVRHYVGITSPQNVLPYQRLAADTANAFTRDGRR
ncbi:MAG: site-specific integrase [Clostridia bacterium]|nr:site-specific integrase [Clostridia bacterium]